MIKVDDIKIFADGLDHPECVIYHPDGSVWAGGEAGQIYRISNTGCVDEVANTSGFVLGMALHPNLEWMAICDSKKKCIWRLDMNGFDLVEFAHGADRHSFNIPNYVCFDTNGNLFASESGEVRSSSGKILKFDSKGEGIVWHDGPFIFANGICLDAEEAFLYVVCTFSHSVERIQIMKDGTSGKRETYVQFHKTLPDGIAFDRYNNLFVSCYAPNTILKVTPDRSVSTVVDDWEAHTLSNPTNIAFGGKDMNQLYIANLGRWHISVIETNTRGLSLPCHKSYESI